MRVKKERERNGKKSINTDRKKRGTYLRLSLTGETFPVKLNGSKRNKRSINNMEVQQVSAVLS